MKPHILISGTEGKMDNYIRAVKASGGIAAAQYAPAVNAEGFDALLLCGGGDITPALYGGEDGGLNHGIDPVREASDLEMIAAFLRQEKPVLGICRGMQMLNVFFGGTLVQDLGEGNRLHLGEDADKYHMVNALPGSVFQWCYGAEFVVNSFHHQAVLHPGRGLRVTCRAQDGTAEGIEHEYLPLLGVQWHPERHSEGWRLMEHFVLLCKEKTGSRT